MSKNRYHGIESYAVSYSAQKSRKLIRTPLFIKGDFEDLQQELIIAYLHAIPKFDSERGDKRSFIKTVINTRAAMILRDAETQKRWSGIRNISLHEQIGEELELIDTISAEENTDIDLKLDLEFVLKDMPEELRHLFKHLKTKKLTEIAEDTGIPRTTLSSRLKRLREYLEANLGKNIF